MKITFTLFLFFLCAFKGHSQQDTITPKIEKLIEKWCPIYILDNYCSQTGLTDIYRKIKVDDRVSGITKVANIREPSQDSMTVVKYNNVSISFENWQDVEYLHTFLIYFEKKEDMEMFSVCYMYLMGFMMDEKDPTRFYYKNAPMNAVMQNSVPEKKFYFATCFVYQPGYCGD
jgi:hypothetical protein